MDARTVGAELQMVRRLQSGPLRVLCDPLKLRHGPAVTSSAAGHDVASALSGTDAARVADGRAADPRIAALISEMAELAPDDWEDLPYLENADGAPLPPSLALPPLPPPSAGATATVPLRAVDYSRPPAYQTRAVPSIYHVSHGSQPYYGERRGTNATHRHAQTDAHGLRL